jgi:hypothetical protein
MTFDTTSREPPIPEPSSQGPSSRRWLFPVVILGIVAVLVVVAFGLVNYLRDAFSCTAVEREPLAALVPPSAISPEGTDGRCVAAYETEDSKDALYERFAGNLSSRGFSVTKPPDPTLVSGRLVDGEKDGLTLEISFESPEALSSVEKLRDPDAKTIVTLDSYRRSLSEPLVDSCFDPGAVNGCALQ